MSSALIAFAVAVVLGAPTVASAQQPTTGLPPAPAVDATNPGTVYGWVDGCGRIIPYQTPAVSYQPVYTVRYYNQAPCNTVCYTRPSCYSYQWSGCYRPAYYRSSCGTSRRWFRSCR